MWLFLLYLSLFLAGPLACRVSVGMLLLLLSVYLCRWLFSCLYASVCMYERAFCCFCAKVRLRILVAGPLYGSGSHLCGIPPRRRMFFLSSRLRFSLLSVLQGFKKSGSELLCNVLAWKYVSTWRGDGGLQITCSLLPPLPP